LFCYAFFLSFPLSLSLFWVFSSLLFWAYLLFFICSLLLLLLFHSLFFSVPFTSLSFLSPYSFTSLFEFLFISLFFVLFPSFSLTSISYVYYLIFYFFLSFSFLQQTTTKILWTCRIPRAHSSLNKLNKSGRLLSVRRDLARHKPPFGSPQEKPSLKTNLSWTRHWPPYSTFTSSSCSCCCCCCFSRASEANPRKWLIFTKRLNIEHFYFKLKNVTLVYRTDTKFNSNKTKISISAFRKALIFCEIL